VKAVLIFGVLGMQAACCLDVVGSSAGSTAGIPGGSSGATGTGGSVGTGGGSTTGDASCGGNGNECSSLANGAPIMRIVDVPMSAPPPAGGATPPDGIYYLTSVWAYTGESGASGQTSDTERATLQLSGSGTEIALVIDYDGCVQTVTGSVSLAGTQAMIGVACPGVEAGSGGYSSSLSSLTLFLDGNGSDGPSFVPMVQVYTLQ
jgi:hypothetical protein